MLAFSMMEVESLYVGEARSQWKGNEPQVMIERERERMTSKTTALGAAAQISAAPASGCGPPSDKTSDWYTLDGRRANSAELSQKMQMAL